MMPEISGERLLKLMAETIADMDHDTRWTMRRAIEATGAVVISYDGDHLTVALPRPAAPAIEAIEAEGYRVSDLRYFPLGSDSPADRLRHALLAGGNRGWWLFANIR